MPDWIRIRPSGVITKRPSYPVDPATKELVATPYPRILKVNSMNVDRIAGQRHSSSESLSYDHVGAQRRGMECRLNLT